MAVSSPAGEEDVADPPPPGGLTSPPPRITWAPWPGPPYPLSSGLAASAPGTISTSNVALSVTALTNVVRLALICIPAYGVTWRATH